MFGPVAERFMWRSSGSPLCEALRLFLLCGAGSGESTCDEETSHSVTVGESGLGRDRDPAPCQCSAPGPSEAEPQSSRDLY